MDELLKVLQANALESRDNIARMLGAAVGTDALHIPVGQEHVLDRIVGLLDRAPGNMPGLGQPPPCLALQFKPVARLCCFFQSQFSLNNFGRIFAPQIFQSLLFPKSTRADMLRARELSRFV